VVVSLSSLSKRLLYKSGALSTYHRGRNKRTLTVVMFHRVMPESDPRWTDADPVWTVPDWLFQDCLGFFLKHYHIVSVDDVRLASAGGTPLPDHSLLITFDDGWADNEEYALKPLKEGRIPAVVFAVAGGIGTAELWQEKVRRVFRSGKVTKEYTRRLWLAATSGESGTNREITSSADVEELIQLLADLSGAIREELLCDLGEPSPPHILSVAQLNRLHRSGIDIGSHGLTHIPIPKSGDIWRELRTSRETLASLLTEPQPQAPTALSFPHGIYDSECVRAAISSGYEVLFTSEPHLNGRGQFRPELLALWLFSRPCACSHS
jgi:peptidoglycan/xylan/chitin deacetylase (PgdA/CDA1 family)